jgi:hypothetical protein
VERREQKTPRLQGTSTGREERLGDERLALPVNRLLQAEVKKYLNDLPPAHDHDHAETKH